MGIAAKDTRRADDNKKRAAMSSKEFGKQTTDSSAVTRCPGFIRQEDLSPGQIQNNRQDYEGDKRKRISIHVSRSIKERVLRLRPFRQILGHISQSSRHVGDENPGNRSTGNVAGGHQHTATLIALGNQLLFGHILSCEFLSQVKIDQPAYHSTDKDRARRRKGQVNSNRKGE